MVQGAHILEADLQVFPGREGLARRRLQRKIAETQLARDPYLRLGEMQLDLSFYRSLGQLQRQALRHVGQIGRQVQARQLHIKAGLGRLGKRQGLAGSTEGHAIELAGKPRQHLDLFIGIERGDEGQLEAQVGDKMLVPDRLIIEADLAAAEPDVVERKVGLIALAGLRCGLAETRDQVVQVVVPISRSREMDHRLVDAQ